MSDTFTTVAHKAMKARLKTTSSIPADELWELEGREFVRPTGQIYLRETLKPFASKRKSLGANTFRVRYSGLWLIDVFEPLPLKGASGGDALADAIVDHFWHGLQLIRAGLVVTIQESSRTGAQQETNWRQVPVSISYWFDRVITP